MLPRGVADKVFFDSDLPGFGLRVRATGAKTWMAQYAIAGRTRRVVLGSTAVLDPGARKVLARAKLGEDPASDKAEQRAKAKDTTGALIETYLERHQRPRLRPRSFEE